MVLVMRVIIRMGKSMARVHLSGLMDLFILEILIKIIFQVLVNIHGKMIENMLESGKTIKWMEKE